MNEHITINGSPTADGYYTTLSPNEVTVDSSDESSGSSSSDGDFSIAKVICPNGLPGHIPCIADDDGDMFSATFDPDVEDTHEVSAILYKGSCLFYSSVDMSLVEIDGAIASVGAGAYVITGDCTITVNTSLESSPSQS